MPPSSLARRLITTMLTLLLAALVASCATAPSLTDAKLALEEKDFTTALRLCNMVAKDFPDDPNVRQCVEDANGAILLNEANTIMLQTANYNFFTKDKPTAYDKLVEASTFSPEFAYEADIISTHWADQFWSFTKRYWKESEELGDLFSNSVQDATLSSRSENGAGLQTSIINLFDQFIKKQELAFTHYLLLERIFPTYSWRQCSVESAPICSQIRKAWEATYVPKISVPMKLRPGAPSQATIYEYQIADVARRASQSTATIISLGTKGLTKRDQDIVSKVLVEKYQQYRVANGSAAICLRPDMSFGVEARPLRQIVKGLNVLDYARHIFSADNGVRCQGIFPDNSGEKDLTKTRITDRMSNQEVNDFMADKIMKIYIDTWFGRTGSFVGSGFAVNDGGYVITNYHVVCPTREIEIEGDKQVADDCVGIGRPTRIQVRWLDSAGVEQTARASLVSAWKDEDLALLLVLPQGTLDAERRLSPLSFSGNRPNPLLEVLSYGYPELASVDRLEGSIESLVPTVTDGIVSRLIERPWIKGRTKLTVVQHTAAITGGNSGGPVIDRCGRVVGVNTEGFVAGEKEKQLTVVPSGINFAAFAGDVVGMLEQLKIHHIIEPGQCSEARPRELRDGAAK